MGLEKHFSIPVCAIRFPLSRTYLCRTYQRRTERYHYETPCRKVVGDVPGHSFRICICFGIDRGGSLLRAVSVLVRLVRRLQKPVLFAVRTDGGLRSFRLLDQQLLRAGCLSRLRPVCVELCSVRDRQCWMCDGRLLARLFVEHDAPCSHSRAKR
jgi:hypothetical protein